MMCLLLHSCISSQTSDLIFIYQEFDEVFLAQGLYLLASLRSYELRITHLPSTHP